MTETGGGERLPHSTQEAPPPLAPAATPSPYATIHLSFAEWLDTRRDAYMARACVRQCAKQYDHEFLTDAELGMTRLIAALEACRL